VVRAEARGPVGARVQAARESVAELAAVVAPVEAAELGLVVVARGLAEEAAAAAGLVLAEALEAVEVVLEAQGAGRGQAAESVVVAETRHLASGSRRRRCCAAPRWVVAAQWLAELAAGPAAAALGLALRKKMSVRCWGCSLSSGSPAKIPKRKWMFRRFSRA
jgi:hypothetical protein